MQNELLFTASKFSNLTIKIYFIPEFKNFWFFFSKPCFHSKLRKRKIYGISIVHRINYSVVFLRRLYLYEFDLLRHLYYQTSALHGSYF